MAFDDIDQDVADERDFYLKQQSAQIEQLTATIARLREALRPFAAVPHRHPLTIPTVDAYVHAAAVYAETEPDKRDERGEE